MIHRFIYSILLFLLFILSTGIAHSATTSIGSIFVPRKNPTINTGVSYTFSAASGSGVRYVNYALCDNSFANCNTFFATPLSNTLPYGSYSISNIAVAQLLQQIQASANTYYIGLSVLSEGLNCSSAYCFTNQDSGNTTLGFTAVYDGTNVTPLTQNDNGNVTLNQ